MKDTEMMCPETFWECRVDKWLWVIVSPCLLVVGTLGNLLSVAMFSRKPLRRYSTSVFLIMLAVSDTLLLWSALFGDIMKHVAGLNIVQWSNVLCKATPWISYSSGGFSAWTVTHLTLERLLFTKFPFKAKLLITPRIAVCVSGITFVIIQLQTSQLLFGNTLGGDINVTQCIRTSTGFGVFYESGFQYLVLISFNFLPVMVIVCSNCLTALAIRSKRRKVGVSFGNRSTNIRQERNAIKMLFVVSFFFVLCTTPYCLFRVLASGRIVRVTSHKEATIVLTKTFVTLLLYSNFTFNFVLYLASGTLFKKEWNRTVQSCMKSTKTKKPESAVHISIQHVPAMALPLSP